MKSEKLHQRLRSALQLVSRRSLKITENEAYSPLCSADRRRSAVQNLEKFQNKTSCADSQSYINNKLCEAHLLMIEARNHKTTSQTRRHGDASSWRRPWWNLRVSAAVELRKHLAASLIFFSLYCLGQRFCYFSCCWTQNSSKKFSPVSKTACV